MGWLSNRRSGRGVTTLGLGHPSAEPTQSRPDGKFADVQTSRLSNQDRAIGGLIDQWDLGPNNSMGKRVVAYGSAAIEPLMARLEPDHPKYESALTILSQLLEQISDPRPLPNLIEALKGTIKHARIATNCLGNVGDRSAVPALKELEERIMRERKSRYQSLEKPNYQQSWEEDCAQEAIKHALVKLGEHSLIASLLGCRGDRQQAVKQTLIRVGSPALPDLLNCLANFKLASNHGMACDVLAEIGDESCIRPLIEAGWASAPKDKAANALAKIIGRCAAEIAEGDLLSIAGLSVSFMHYPSREDHEISVATKVDYAEAKTAANRELNRRRLSATP
jgi:hypothetical protein